MASLAKWRWNGPHDSGHFPVRPALSRSICHGVRSSASLMTVIVPDDLNPRNVERFRAPLRVPDVNEHRRPPPPPFPVEADALPPVRAGTPVHRAVNEAADGERRTGLCAHETFSVSSAE